MRYLRSQLTSLAHATRMFTYLIVKCILFKKDVEQGKWIGCRKADCTYPWGFDPKWFVASNDLKFINGFKMKWAVIAGVIQMTFGIILKCLNSIQFKNGLVFVFEFIP
jgi:hypothetical protein